MGWLEGRKAGVWLEYKAVLEDRVGLKCYRSARLHTSKKTRGIARESLSDEISEEFPIQKEKVVR